MKGVSFLNLLLVPVLFFCVLLSGKGFGTVLAPRAGEIGQVAVSCRIRGRGGPVRVNISQEMMPLSDFLNIFGLTLQDVQNYL